MSSPDVHMSKKDLKETVEIWRNPARVILGFENLLWSEKTYPRKN